MAEAGGRVVTLRPRCTVFVVTFQPAPGTNPVRSLRRVLKFALRVCGLRCVSAVEQAPPRRKAVP
jgi:hypothetical protein